MPYNHITIHVFELRISYFYVTTLVMCLNIATLYLI